MPPRFGRIEPGNGTLFFGDTGEQIATVSTETVVDSITTSELSELVEKFSDLQKASLSGTFAVNDFMDAVIRAWEMLGDDYELGDEEEYTPTDPISFDELMDIGGDEQ